MTDDIDTRLADIERRLAALEAAQRESIGENDDAAAVPPPEIPGERRTDLRPFPAARSAPPAEGSVPAAGDGAGDPGED